MAWYHGCTALRPRSRGPAVRPTPFWTARRAPDLRGRDPARIESGDRSAWRNSWDPPASHWWRWATFRRDSRRRMGRHVGQVEQLSGPAARGLRPAVISRGGGRAGVPGQLRHDREVAAGVEQVAGPGGVCGDAAVAGSGYCEGPLATREPANGLPVSPLAASASGRSVPNSTVSINSAVSEALSRGLVIALRSRRLVI